MKSIRSLRAAFARVDAARVVAARNYADLLSLYNTLNARDKRDIYPDVVEAYQEAERAFQKRGRAAAALDAAEAIAEREADEESILDDVRDGLDGIYDVGTEFELTATTQGGSPKGKK